MPPIYVGSEKVSELYVGGSKIKEVYVGSHKVFSSGGDEPVPGYEFVDYIEQFATSSNLSCFYESNVKPIASSMSVSDVFEFSLRFSGNEIGSAKIFNNNKNGNGVYTGLEICFYKGSNGFRLYSSAAYGYSYETWYCNWDGTPFDYVLTKINKRKYNLVIPQLGEHTYSFSYDSTVVNGGMIKFVFAYRVGERVYYARIWDSTKTTLKHEILPARNKASGNPCFIDNITKEVFELNTTYFRAVKA